MTAVTSDPGAAATAQCGDAWTAQWIWDAGHSVEPNTYVHLRREIELPAPLVAASVRVTADSEYILLANGRVVGRGPVRSSASSRYYDTWDLRPHLRPGSNCIAALVHYFGAGNSHYLVGRGAFLCQAELRFADGQVRALESDASWRTLRSPIWSPTTPRENVAQGFLEVADLRRDPVGWTEAGFDDTGWAAAVELGTPPLAPWLTLLPRDIPPLHEAVRRPHLVVRTGEVVERAAENVPLQVQAEEVEAVSTVRIERVECLVEGAGGGGCTVVAPVAGRAAAIVLDLGREVAGYPFVELEGVDGAVVDVSFSEYLKDGRVLAARPEIEGFPMYTSDRVVLREGRQRWQRFSPTGLRFLQLTIRNCARPVRVLDAGVVESHYPFEQRGRFRSSDPVLDAVWELGAYSTRICTHDAYVDCPWRERAQWVDMVTPLVSYYAFGDRAIAARYLRTLATSIDDNGEMHLPFPSSNVFELPDQTMWWAMHLWQYHLHFDDREVLAELYPALRRVARRFETKRSGRGLLTADNWDVSAGERLWVWIDWGHRTAQNGPGQAKEGEIGALNVLYFRFLEDAARVARALGEDEDAERWETQAEAHAERLREAYWDPATGIMWDDVEHTIRGDQAGVLAVLYGVLPGAERRALEALLDSEHRLGTSSPHFYHFVFEAMARAGLYERALEAMRLHWGGMIERGATTTWELFDPYRAINSHISEDLWSLCHAYSAGPTYSLSTEVLGVRPLAPGFARLRVAPQLGVLSWAEGEVPTPHGAVKVSWWHEPTGPVRLALTVPDGTLAEVELPARESLSADERPAEVRPVVVGPGVHSFVVC